VTLALAIAFNAVLILALFGTLITVMSRAARLRPHVPAAAPTTSQPAVLRRPTRPRGALRPDAAVATVRV
jgi:hypothetical protein